MKQIQFTTTWGTITLTLEGDTVTHCALPHLETAPRHPFGPHPPKLARSEIAFFWELKRAFPSFAPSGGTAFQKKVWDALKKIPYGQIRTYGEIAAAIGHPGAARAVGLACGANPLPIFIPCHRVVSKNSLGGFRSGWPWKQLLLDLEAGPVFDGAPAVY